MALGRYLALFKGCFAGGKPEDVISIPIRGVARNP